VPLENQPLVKSPNLGGVRPAASALAGISTNTRKELTRERLPQLKIKNSK
jgi:hypothetical protein